MESVEAAQILALPAQARLEKICAAQEFHRFLNRFEDPGAY
jgi:hypothetical protein